MTSLSEAGRKGGKATQAKLTAEERTRRGRKAGRTLGKEGRAARAAKGWETRRKAAEAESRLVRDLASHPRAGVNESGPEYEIRRALVEIDKAEAKGQIHPTNAAEMREAVKLKHALSKPGIEKLEADVMPDYGGDFGPKQAAPMTERVLRWLEAEDARGAKGVPAARIANAMLEPISAVRNALPALQRSGRVVSEPMPGSKREKLWRLA